ncbi:MAG: hypothetical protein LBR22_04200 [Desulfovibrio sp.]|nr:hypothetical protein [Desulfovibrio sp.]
MSRINGQGVPKRELFEMAQSGTLPEGYSGWDIADRFGWTVAHVAARYGNLPDGFDKWDIGAGKQFSRDGRPNKFDDWTVAHEAAKWGSLPSGFDGWDIEAGCGWTVAHVAAQWGRLPRGVDQWNLCDDTGTTVAHEAARHGTLPWDAPDDVMGLVDGKGRTVEDLHGRWMTMRVSSIIETLIHQKSPYSECRGNMAGQGQFL